MCNKLADVCLKYLSNLLLFTESSDGFMDRVPVTYRKSSGLNLLKLIHNNDSAIKPAAQVASLSPDHASIFHQLTELSDKAIIIVSESYEISFINKKARRIFARYRNDKDRLIEWLFNKIPLKIALEQARKTGSNTSRLIVHHKKQKHHVKLFVSHHAPGYSIMFENISEKIEHRARFDSISKVLELFLYKLSHDLKGPVATLMGLINLTKLEHKQDSEVPYFEMINDHIGHLDALVSRIIKLSYVFDMQCDVENVDVYHVLKEAVNLCSHMDNFQHASIQVSAEEQLSFGFDPVILTSIVQILLEHTLKNCSATALSGSFISVEASRYSHSGVMIVIEEGPGINLFNSSNADAKLLVTVLQNALKKINGKLEVLRPYGGDAIVRLLLPSLKE